MIPTTAAGLVAGNCARVRERIHRAARRAGRSPADVTLVAATKNQSMDLIQEAVEAGITVLGENRVQEAAEKISLLSGGAVDWHFLGHLQTNKAARASGLFSMIQSVDSLRLARILDRVAEERGQVMRILLEVNVSGEPSKHGFLAQTLAEAVEDVSRMKHLRLQGLMTMAPLTAAPEEVRPVFAGLRRLRDGLASQWVDMDLSVLSMGMTDDYEVAVEEGATMVRLGRAIFGADPR
ncbi:MAG TPA: YggS family pyridoxal phosphate-dependent enzyme [Chloroflexota bacterium]|nr:YggS family pyridoxal phosphate-dependent enzyme [Chloroflexota bacterium]